MLTIKKEFSINEFEPWCGAVDTLDTIRNNNMIDDLEYLLEDLYPDGIGETELNDLLWFDSDWLLESLGLQEEEEEEEEEEY